MFLFIDKDLHLDIDAHVFLCSSECSCRNLAPDSTRSQYLAEDDTFAGSSKSPLRGCPKYGRELGRP